MLTDDRMEKRLSVRARVSPQACGWGEEEEQQGVNAADGWYRGERRYKQSDTLG